MNGAGADASFDDRYRQMRRVTLIGAAVNIVLAAAKIVLGLLGHSQALVADGLHSLSDLATDGIVLVAARYGSQDADIDHPYGHARIETAATVALGAVLLLVALGITMDAVQRLLKPDLLLAPGLLALGTAVVSVLSKEALYHYSIRVADQTRSDMLRANAWHHRSDALSSVVVIVGVAGTMAGFSWFDAVAAIGVALMIGWIGISQGWASMRELVDTGLAGEELVKVRQTILGVPGVESLHMLKTRRMGGDILVEVHILLSDARISVSEGHQISEAVAREIRRAVPNIRDVTVHIDPEDDERTAPNRNLPSRAEMTRRLHAACRSAGMDCEPLEITFHYLNGRLDADLVFPLNRAGTDESVAALRARIVDAIGEDPDMGDVTLYFR